MKRKLLSGVLALLLCFALSAAVFAAADVSGRYNATSCEKDGISYTYDNEYLQLNPDGTGTVTFSGTPYKIEWTLSGSVFRFEDEEGYEMDGTYRGGVISGNYAGYDFTYELAGAASATPTPAAQTAAPAQTDAPAAEPEPDPAPAAPGWEYDGVLYGTYYAESSLGDGYSYDVSGEYLVLNEDGSAMLVYNYCAFPCKWSLDGERFSLTDNRDYTMSGTLSGGVLEAQYNNFAYVYRKGPDAPIVALSPENWNRGLPYVVDQANLLSDSEEARLNAEAESLAYEYGCGVYVVTLDDLRNYCPSKSRATCSEEIRVGYDLGLGKDRNCILLMMSMADREYDICVYGPMADEAFNEYARSTIEDAMLDDFREDDWYEGYLDYQSQCARLLSAEAAGKPVTANNNPAAHARHIFVPIVIAFIISIIFCSIKKGKMRSVKEQQRAANYIPDRGVHIGYRHDQFVNSTVVRVYDPPQSKSSSGGGGGGHSSSGHSHSGGHF